MDAAGPKLIETDQVDAAAEQLHRLSVFAAVCDEDERLDDGITRTPTSLPRLDAALGGGLAVPSLNVIGAGPKASKSTLAQIIATRHVEAGGTAYVLDLENGVNRFLRRLACRRAKLGPAEVAAALRNERSGVFTSRQDAERWRAAKAWVRDVIGPRLFVEFSPPKDFEARLGAVRALAGDRPVLVVIDSLQKLPMDFADRRASTDKWVRLFELLRYKYGLVFLLVSEIKRSQRGAYEASESSFKESGGIEYAADLAMTLERASADEDGDGLATLRVQLARECDEDPRGDVASYRPVRPYYGLEEVDAVPTARRKAKGPGPRPVKAEAAERLVREELAAGAIRTSDLLAKGKEVGSSEATVRRALKAVGAVRCTVRLKDGWKLP